MWAPTRKMVQVEVIRLLGCSAKRRPGCEIPGPNHRNESWGSSGHLVDLIYEAKGGKNRVGEMDQSPAGLSPGPEPLDCLRHWKGTWKILRKALQSVGLPEEWGRSRSFAEIKKQFW